MDEEKVEKNARILWHDLYDNQGPLVGVAEYGAKGTEKKFLFCRNNTGSFDLRKIKEESWDIVRKNHEKYREENGGHTDHNPSLYFSRIFRKDTLKVVVTPLFDYESHTDKNIFITLLKEDFDWFFPPRMLVERKQ